MPIIPPAQNDQDLTDPNPILLITGWIGDGKSSWTLSGPADTDYFAIEPGAYTAAVKDEGVKKWLASKGRTEIPYNRIRPMHESFKDFLDTWAWYREQATAEAWPCRTIVVDTVTRLHLLGLEHFGLETRGIAARGDMASFWFRLCQQARQFGYIFALVSHLYDMRDKAIIVPQDDKNPANKHIRAKMADATPRDRDHHIVPAVGGQGGETLQREASGVYQIENVNGVVKVFTKRQGDMRRKDRYGFAPVEVDMSFAEMLSRAGYIDLIDERREEIVKEHRGKGAAVAVPAAVEPAPAKQSAPPKKKGKK